MNAAKLKSSGVWRICLQFFYSGLSPLESEKKCLANWVWNFFPLAPSLPCEIAAQAADSLFVLRSFLFEASFCSSCRQPSKKSLPPASRSMYRRMNACRLFIFRRLYIFIHLLHETALAPSTCKVLGDHLKLVSIKLQYRDSLIDRCE